MVRVAEVVSAEDWPAGTYDARYPWDEWFDGQMWKLRRGEDFDVMPSAFRSAISMAASRRRVKVTTRIREDVVFLQRLDETAH
jgi:hypothetical protein